MNTDLKVSTSTIIRTICLILALVNQYLTAAGHSVLPISDDQIAEIVSWIITAVTALVNWWKNNSFTKPALMADETLKRHKKEEVA